MECDTISVRVMRSFDYCHFEVVLGVTCEPSECVDVSHADNLRKEAARLADKAVEQYKVKKADIAAHESSASLRQFRREKAGEIEKKAETDRTPEEQAWLKSYHDAVFESNRQYDYQDDWEEGL